MRASAHAHRLIATTPRNSPASRARVYSRAICASSQAIFLAFPSLSKA